MKPPDKIALFAVRVKYRGKHLLSRIPCASYRDAFLKFPGFNPYVFTFDLETETICTLINYISIRTESHINICMTSSIDNANSNFRYDRCACEGHIQLKVFYAFYQILW